MQTLKLANIIRVRERLLRGCLRTMFSSPFFYYHYYFFYFSFVFNPQYSILDDKILTTKQEGHSGV